MQEHTTFELPFGQRAELELRTEWGHLTLLPVEPGHAPRLELSRSSADNTEVHIDKHGATVRVALDPHRSFNWFGGWECRATLYLPSDVRAHVQTDAGSVSVRDFDQCELGVKASAGKIDLNNVFGLIHLAADAGSVSGRDVGGTFDVQTQAGSVRLEICDLRPGEHRIRAGMGSLRIELPRDLDVCVETHSGVGTVRNSYPSNPSAAARLVLTTDMGSMRIEPGASSRRRGSSATEPAPVAPPPAPREDPELDRILKMVEAGELSAHDADELLRAMGRV
jgi:hypothetical protein